MSDDLPSVGTEDAPKTYECTVIFDASNSVTVEAFSPEEAAYMAMDLCDGNQSLCHQCARALDTGDPIGVHVYHDGEQVADTSWSGEQVARLTAERDALASRVKKLEAEREAAAEAACGAVRKAFSLGQTYWQQAESEYTSEHRKAEDTWAKFKELVKDARATLNAPKEQP